MFENGVLYKKLKRLFYFTLRYRFLVVAGYMILFLIATFFVNSVRINFDLKSYLPDSYESKKGEQILIHQFQQTDIGYLVIPTQDPTVIVPLKDKLEAVDGVQNIVWSGDFEDAYMPVSFLPDELQKVFYPDHATLLKIVFTSTKNYEFRNNTIRQIREISGKGAIFGGEPIIISEIQSKLHKQSSFYTLIGIGIIFLVLLLALRSYTAPFLLMLNLGLAILLNMGTNGIHGNISFLTKAIAPAMQLGTSIDLSIFLFHRFEEERSKFTQAKDALCSAVKKSFLPIGTSAMTTVVGFLVLTAMRNGIGKDLGFVLTKGMLISFAVNFTLLPCLLLIFDPWIFRFTHASLLPSFGSISRFLTKRKVALSLLVLLIVLPMIWFQGKNKFYSTNEKQLSNKAFSIQQTTQIRSILRLGETLQLVIPKKERTKEPHFLRQLETMPNISHVSGLSQFADPYLPDWFIPKKPYEQFVSGDYQLVQINLKAIKDATSLFRTVNQIRTISHATFQESYLTGSLAMSLDMQNSIGYDLNIVNILTIGLCGLIILLAFRSFSISWILLFVVQAAIWVNLGINFLENRELFILTPLFIEAIQMGATSDYAILFASRFLENRLHYQDRNKAIQQSIQEAGPSILLSALTLLSATIGVAYLSEIESARAITLLIGRGAIFGMVAILLSLPAIFYWMDSILPKRKK
jgi:predicted RND superfamily exporter protein